MGLTRLRAEQISDIDYKQAVRVITVTNVTLAGGAPTPVDGVNLSAGDRVLVTAQNTGSQNGLYQVQTVGSGSNGTWIRTTDGNTTGEIEAGMIVMVTEGTVYADTQWKLTTNDPIVIGTTALTFEQNSAFAFGNILANGTAVLANSVGSTVTFTAGNNIAITGNNTSKTVTFDVTGISLNSISNGTSNVNVVSSGGNVTVGVGGTSNIAVFSTSGLDVTGRVSATGNVTGGNLLTSGSLSAGSVTSNLVPATSDVFSLGNSTNRWANLWLTGNTIYLGNAIITAADSGDIIIDSSGSFAVPVGTTAERSEITGAIRYNTTVGVFETYDGVGWNTLAYGTQTDFPLDDYGSVSDAATTDAFGVSIASTFDCNSEGPFSFTDLATGEAYVGA
jgi:hypothetical protein